LAILAQIRKPSGVLLGPAGKMTTIYDTHSHIVAPPFRVDIEQVVARAQQAGVAKIIAVGTDLNSSKSAIELAERFACVYAAVGWHPNDANDAPQDLKSILRPLAGHPKVVAIGETGLDYYHLPSREKKGGPVEDEHLKNNQARIFQEQIELAFEMGMPLIIHQRQCFDAVVAQMRPWAGRVRAVFHCFSETAEAARQLLDLGWIVSFTGTLTYKNAQNVRDSLAAVPFGKFMLETDCPYLVPEPHRSNKIKRCEPAFVRETAEVAARVKGCGLEEIGRATCETAEEFFVKLRA